MLIFACFLACFCLFLQDSASHARQTRRVGGIDRKALLQRCASQDKKQNKKLVMLVMKDSKPGEPLLLHDEPIYNDKGIIGRTTSGNFSFNYNKNIAFGYINFDFAKEELLKQNLFIEVEKKKYPVSTISKPLNSKNIKLL